MLPALIMLLHTFFSTQDFAYHYANIYEPFSVWLCINFSIASGFSYGVEEAGNVGMYFRGIFKKEVTP